MSSEPSRPQTEGTRPTLEDRREDDTHADIRVFKLFEVAYNCARNGYYDRAAAVAEQAVEHYEETRE